MASAHRSRLPAGGLMGTLPLPSGVAVGAGQLGVSCRGGASPDTRSLLDAAASLLADAGLATSWQLLALLRGVHPDRVSCAEVRRFLEGLAADRRFVVAPVPRPESHLWAPYRVCAHVEDRAVTVRPPASWAAWRDRLGGPDVCMRSVVGLVETPARREAVAAGREQVRMWRRSPQLSLRDVPTGLRLVGLRVPRVRIPEAMRFHHVAALETAAVLWPRIGRGAPADRVLADGRLAHTDLVEFYEGAKRPDVLLRLPGHAGYVAIEFISREYREAEIDLIRRAVTDEWILAASSHQVAARVQESLNRPVYHA